MYKHFTANPKNETNDCIVRSIANATKTEWQTVMRELCDLAIEMYQMPNNGEVVDEYFYKKGIYCRAPKEPITVEQFCKQNPKGAYVLGVAGHALSVIDGDYYDLTDSGNSLVLDYYDIQEGKV